MALTDINISEKLETGAPPIKYEGDMRPTNDQGQQMAGPAGYQRVLEHFLNLGYPYDKAEELAMRAAQSGNLAPSDQEYEPKAFGGIAGLDGRRRYFLGSIKKLFKKATKPIKKVAKKLTSSKLAKLAALAAATYYGGKYLKTPGAGGTSPWQRFFGVPGIDEQGGTMGWLGNKKLTGGFGSYLPTGKGITALTGMGMTAAPFFMDQPQDTIEEASTAMDRGTGIDTEAIAEEVIDAYRSGDEAVKELAYKYNFLPDYESVDVDRLPSAYGGRIGAQEGGLMDLGGMEKDYRDDGGFVPIGGEEKADDVPARLSKNEFVFTADAVRAAGRGDIDQGAEIMENVMKNLEAGGEISEESQGLEGAQDMFATSERLSEVI